MHDVRNIRKKLPIHGEPEQCDCDTSKMPLTQGAEHESFPPFPSKVRQNAPPLAFTGGPLYIAGMNIHQNAFFRLSFAGMAERHWRSHL